MPHFPMFVDLKNKPILIVGGGAVALRKLKKLAPYGAVPTVVAPKIAPEIIAMGVEVKRRCFCEGDLMPRPALVIAATDDKVINREVARLCKNANIPVNAADSPEDCTFLFPALVRRGEFSVGISTGGASPTAAVYFKERLEQQIPENLEEILDWLAEQRIHLKKTIPDQAKRAGIFRRMFDVAMEKGSTLTDAETARCMEAALGRVDLVGAGCGRADLITVRGLKLLQQCQAVVYDDLIDPALLDAAPETARRIYMGKRSGAHSASQSEINETLIDLAQEGLRVVRLKGGDPYLFGRGGEEMLALKEAGIPCAEVPGIPSPMGIPAEYGIPVTHRGLSRGLHIVTAHTSDTPDGLPADFDHLAHLEGTLVFLMGLAQAERISNRLLAAGKSGDTPAAVLSGGNSANPACIRTTLADLPQKAKNVRPPAIILVGEVAAVDLCHRQRGTELIESGRKVVRRMHRYKTLLDRFTDESRNILGENLVGIYLHGSAAMGCFNPAKSDLDLLIVVEETLSDDVKRRYMDMVIRLNEEAPAKGLELSVLRRVDCENFVHPMPFDLHFSITHLDWYRRDPAHYIETMKGTDRDLAAHIMILHRKGVALYGAPIREVFAPVPREAYIDSIRADVADAEEQIIHDPVYMTLNLCRVMAFIRENLVLSKLEGGRWGLGNLPWAYHSVIESALAAYTSDGEMKVSEEKLRVFARFLLDRIGLRVEMDTLSAELFLELYTAVGREAPCRDQVAAALERTLAAFTAYDGDHPVGMVRLLGDGGMSFYMKDFAVLPSRQHSGVGRFLMNAVESYIRRTVEPGWAVSLELISTREAAGFYQKMGFEERPCSWDGPGMFKMIR